jgi:spermidine/putrescine transport system substrate-binding protein
MSHPLRSLAAAAALFGLAAAPVAAEGRLNVYNWGDYINPEVLDRFAEEYGVDVSLDTYSSNEEMLAKIQAGATGYDIIFPSVHMQDIMHNLDLLERTGINEHPDFGNIDPASLFAETDPEGEYCLPYAWGSVGIVYNKAVAGEITSWEEFFQIPEKTGGRITLLDDMREVMAVGLIMTGHSVNSTDPDALAEATEYLLAQRDKVSAFTYDTQALIGSGDIAAGHFFVGVNILVKQRPDELGYVIPAEGATMYQENICVLKSAPNKENAMKFLEFYLRPEIAALNVSQQMNGTPNVPARALTPDFIKDDPNITPDAETMERLEIFQELGGALRMYDRAWNRVRTAQ